jgi:hypothetical protein
MSCAFLVSSMRATCLAHLILLIWFCVLLRNQLLFLLGHTIKNRSQTSNIADFLFGREIYIFLHNMIAVNS